MIRGAGKNYARHSGTRAKPASPESITTNGEVLDAIRDYLHVRDYGFRAPRFARPRNDERLGTRLMAFGYRYKLERQRNDWWLARFPGIPAGRCRDKALAIRALIALSYHRSSPRNWRFMKRCGNTAGQS